jgi:acetyl esterase/lipase
VFSGPLLTPGNGAEAQPSYIYKTIGERTLKVDVDYPPGWKASDRRPLMIFFSGGAFRAGNTRQFAPQAAYFAKRGLVCVRAEYRDRTRDKVEPDTCLKDAISAMRWVRKNAAMLGADPDRIISAGGSAGGFLAASACTTRDFHGPGDDLSISPRPNAMVLFNPVVDFVSLDRSFGKMSENKKLLEQISPLRNLTADLPPTLILIGSKDGFFEQVNQFVTAGRKLGARVERFVAEDQPHAFFNKSPWMEKTAVEADAFLQSLGYLKPEPKVPPPSPVATN